MEKSDRWEFEPLLMADPKVKGKTHARHSGVAFLKIATKAPRRSQLNLDPKEQIPYINGKGKKVFSKRPMLLAQMWDAYYKNPKSEIDMIFKDDRADLIEDIIKNLKPTDMPPNVSLELVEFDYTAAPKKMFKTHKTILSSARMIEAFEKLKPDMQSKSRRVDALIDSMQWAANAKFDKSIQSRTKLNPSLDAILSTNQLRRLKRSASLKLKETTGERVEGDSVSAKARGHRFLAELEMANNSKAALCRTLLSIAK